jgi:SpoIID/LytB domain protein
MDGQQSVSVTSPAGLRVHLSGPARTEVAIAAGHTLTARVVDGLAGTTRYRVVLEGLPGGALEALQQGRQRWQDRGVVAEEIELGGVVGLPRRVLDNRKLLLVERGDHATREGAEARSAELARRWQLAEAPSVFAQPVRRARGAIVAVDAATGLTLRQDDLLAITAADGGAVEVKRVEFGRGYAHHGFQDRHYHGEILLAVDPSAQVAVVNRVSSEALLRGLVPAEIFPTAPAAALDAQAISARGELLAKLGVRHLADPFLVCATQHCQVYSGTSREMESTNQAVARTRGRMLFDGHDRLVDSVYSASCGGHTEHNENVWEGVASPPLRGTADGAGRSPWASEIPTEAELRRFIENPPASWCGASRKGAKVFRWQRRFPREELDRLVNARHAIGAVRAVEVLGRGVSGRVKRVRFAGGAGDAVVTGELAVRRLLGNLRSGMFVVDADADGWTFTGGGWGHGVGMCQYGAIGMAEAGRSGERIRQHYFRGSTVQKVY